MEYLIRACEEKDLSRLVELCARHAEWEQCYYDSKEKADALKSAIFSDSPKLFCFVLEDQNTLQGYFSYTLDYSTWDAQTYLHLDCLYLEPDYRGKKIGDVIFEKLKKMAIANNCLNIQLQTPVFNEKAIRFYNRMGCSSKSKVRFFLNTAD